MSHLHYTEIKNGLGTNETLESLELKDVPLRDDNADLWCRALSFLHTNKAPKSLAVHVMLVHLVQRNHVFPPFVSILWPTCCKRTHHL